MLTLSGTASIADYRDSLRSITFEATGENPDAGPRTIRITVSDGDTSGPLDRGLNVTAVDDAPVLTTGLGTTPYPERDAAVIVDPDLTLTDVDSATLTGATATIKTGGQTGDALSFDAPPPGITGVTSGTTVTFTGNASPAAYQAALRGVRFGSSNHDPSAARTIAFTRDRRHAHQQRGHEGARGRRDQRRARRHHLGRHDDLHRGRSGDRDRRRADRHRQRQHEPAGPRP